MNVSGDSIVKEPKLVKGMVKAVVRGLVFVNKHRNELLDLAALEFPAANRGDLQAMASRAFADDIFSHDGLNRRRFGRLARPLCTFPVS